MIHQTAKKLVDLRSRRESSTVPCAFVGGFIDVPTHLFKILVGLVRLYSAIRFLLQANDDNK